MTVDIEVIWLLYYMFIPLFLNAWIIFYFTLITLCFMWNALFHWNLSYVFSQRNYLIHACLSSSYLWVCLLWMNDWSYHTGIRMDICMVENRWMVQNQWKGHKAWSLLVYMFISTLFPRSNFFCFWKCKFQGNLYQNSHSIFKLRPICFLNMCPPFLNDKTEEISI